MIFETPTLKYATQATVSRCGMVWFSHSCITLQMLFYNQLEILKNTGIVVCAGGQKKRTYQGAKEVQKTVVEHMVFFAHDQN